MGASVARWSNRLRRFIGDQPGTAAAVMCSLTACNRVDIELELDGDIHVLPNANNLTVVKNPNIASGLKLDLDIRPDDGTLCLVGVYGQGRIGLCRTFPSFYTGSVTSMPSVFLKQCRSVTIRSQQQQEIEFDGDPRGFLPAHVELMPGALRLIGGAHE